MTMSGDLFPLDIMYSESCVWLVNRRKLPSDWITQLASVQSRVNNAFKQLPLAFASQFSPSDDGIVEYLTARKIRDQLSETGERGYFGGLAGTAGVWDKLVKSYEKNNLYLGEAGQRLTQNVDFEIPFLKKQMESLDKKTLELARLKTEYEGNVVSSTSVFSKQCKELGINGIDLPNEVQLLSDQIYTQLESGVEKIKEGKIVVALKLYRSMSEHLHGSKEDNLSVLEGVLSSTIQPPPSDLIQSQEKKTSTDPASKQQGAAKEEDMVAEINWDLPEIETTQMEELKEEEGGIDWDFDVDIETIQTEDPALLAEASDSIVQSIDETSKPQVNMEEISPSCLRFVWDKEFRNKFLDDLYELQAFLKIRSLADPTDAVLLNFSEVLYKFDHSQISSYLAHLNEIIDYFAGDAAQRYLLLKTSRKYEEHLLEDLRKKSAKPSEWRKAIMKIEQEKKGVQTELSQTAIKIGQLARHTKELKTLVETGISPLFNNRQINIMGKINTLLQTHCKT